MRKLTKEDKRIMKYMIQALERNRDEEIESAVDAIFDVDNTMINICVKAENERLKAIATDTKEIVDRYDAAIESVMEYFYS